MYELTRGQLYHKGRKRYYYGMRIWQYKLEEDVPYDYNEVIGITENYKNAKDLFSQMVEGSVMPVTLYDIVDDWHSAFHPRLQKAA